MKGYLGLDVGSVSTNLAVINERQQVLATVYIRTAGQPVQAVQNGVTKLQRKLPDGFEVVAAGTTGSARRLSKAMIGADIAKNEITAHAVASSHILPDVRTVLEIGGQDSKIIILENGIVVDFAMNTVCAAGTGSFLDHQAERLGIKIQDFGDIALQSETAVNIAGRCTVFAESDMIHKQQMGHNKPDILNGLCNSLVRNYLNNVGKGKKIQPPIMFQGGVAANKGLRRAFEHALGHEMLIPKHFGVMGAIGAALLAQEHAYNNGGATSFHGFDIPDFDYKTTSFDCDKCPNQCEIVQVYMNKKLIARWGGRCGRWDR